MSTPDQGVSPEIVIGIYRKRVSDLEYELALYQAADLQRKEAEAASEPPAVD